MDHFFPFCCDGGWELNIFEELILKLYKRCMFLHLLWYSSLMARVIRVKKIRNLFDQSFIKTPEFPLFLYLLYFIYFFYCFLQLEETLDLTSHTIFILKFPSLVLGKLRQHYIILSQIHYYHSLYSEYYSLLFLLFTIIQYTIPIKWNIFINFL